MLTVPSTWQTLIGSNRADHQLGIRIDSDRQSAAAYTATNDEAAVAVDREFPMHIYAAQRPMRKQDRGTVAEGHLPAVGMACKAYVHLLVA